MVRVQGNATPCPGPYLTMVAASSRLTSMLSKPQRLGSVTPFTVPTPDGSQRKYSEYHRVSIRYSDGGVALSIAGPFAQPAKPVRNASRRGGLPLILMPRLGVLVLKVL